MKLCVLSLLFFFSCIVSSGRADDDGCVCGEFTGPSKITKEVEVTDLAAFATEKKEELSAYVKQQMSSIKVDEEKIKEWVVSVVPDGWGSDKIREVVAEIVAAAVKTLNEQVNDLVPAAVERYLNAYIEAIKILSPKGVFQADLKYKDRCCDTGEWTRGACNRKGYTQAKASFMIEFKFEVGGSALADVTTEAKMKIKGEAGVTLEPFNPVGPTTGSGSSITIIATPNVLVTGNANVEGGVLTIFGGGLDLGYRDTLKDMTATLECGGSK